MKRLILALTLLCAASNASAFCDRPARDVVFSGIPVPVYISPDQWAEVVFPEDLVGILPENPQGLSYEYNDAAFKDRIFFSTNDDAYHGLTKLHGASGKTYQVQLLSRKGCGDSTVNIGLRGNEPQPVPEQFQAENRRKLTEYMWLDEGAPPGYMVSSVPGSPQERLVYRQGPVHFYMEKMYKGVNYTGLVLLVVNHGRTPYRVALEKMDFSSRELREQFGLISEISMMPITRQLDPAPEFAVDNIHAQNQGLVYVVVDNQGKFRGRR